MFSSMVDNAILTVTSPDSFRSLKFMRFLLVSAHHPELGDGIAMGHVAGVDTDTKPDDKKRRLEETISKIKNSHQKR